MKRKNNTYINFAIDLDLLRSNYTEQEQRTMQDDKLQKRVQHIAEYQKQYAKNNVDKVRQHKRKYACSDKRKQYLTEYNATEHAKELARQRDKRWRNSDLEKSRALARERVRRYRARKKAERLQNEEND